ncbi:MAG: hypothetical protein SFW09_19045 [Hyphomicrobiaceae bacterium]|nr:hypothetical protein [Hyphomicrobiaceae bacterium]
MSTVPSVRADARSKLCAHRRFPELWTSRAMVLRGINANASFSSAEVCPYLEVVGMTSMVIWMLGIGISVAALVLTAAMKQFYVHMAIAALISILVALASFAEARKETTRTGSVGVVTGTLLRHMGLVWTWGALSLLVTYAFDILSWREWWQFFIAFFALAGLALFLSATLQKDAANGTSDPAMVNIARGVALFILFAMVVTMVGLLADGKMWRFVKYADRRGSQDWAANNIFFFGAMALAAISWNTLSVIGWRRSTSPA